jgi:hypothetical protein
MAYNNQKTTTLEFKDIVLQDIKKILEISSKELKSSERILVIDNLKTYIETEDSRISYIQAIENLSYVLEAHFDKPMKEVFDKEIKWIDAFGFEILALVDNEVYKKKLKEFSDDKRDEMLLMLQVKHAKSLFRGLNSLLKRVDYLKSSIFGETGGEDDDTVEDEEDSE